ncbi:hypothetical protein AKJ16_DCAP15986 [Drosera capensis]
MMVVYILGKSGFPHSIHANDGHHIGLISKGSTIRGLLLEFAASIRGGGSICFIKLLEPGLRVDPIQQGIHIIVGLLEFHEPFLDVFISELPLLRMVHQRQD